MTVGREGRVKVSSKIDAFVFIVLKSKNRRSSTNLSTRDKLKSPQVTGNFLQPCFDAESGSELSELDFRPSSSPSRPSLHAVHHHLEPPVSASFSLLHTY